MQPIPEHIDELIALCLAGEATETQVAELDQWRAADPLHEQYFTQCAAVFGVQAENDTAAYDIDAAWTKVKAEISEAKVLEMKPQPVTTDWKTAFRIAAILAVIAGITWWLNVLNEYSEPVKITASANIVRDTLPDGSSVTLNRYASLTTKSSFGKNNRTLELKGEAYFNVRHDDELPFIIEANGVFIKDIGTAFNVDASGDSSYVEVIVEEGEVYFYLEGQEGLHLTKGQGAIYHSQTHTITRLENINSTRTAYTTGILRFNNTKLNDAALAISGLYGVLIDVDPAIANCNITVTFNKEDLETVLNVICETLGIQYERIDNHIQLKGSVCRQ